MTPLVIRYPLDPTGASPDNFIGGEKHTLLPNRRVRCIATEYGAFFTSSLVLRDLKRGLVLTKGTQYFPAETYELPTDRYGKEICAIIVITDPEVSDEIEVDYQCLGGEFGTSATAVIQQLEKLKLDDRPIKWGDIIGKPSEYPAAHHYHDAGDIYGFEYVVHALDRIRQAIVMGDTASHDLIYRYVDELDATLRNLIVANNNQFVSHVTDFNNPHKVSATQLNVYIKPEVDSRVTNVNSKIDGHTARKDNPHSVTAQQLGCYIRSEVDTMIANLSKTHGDAINAHVTDRNNPHNVTPGQLGVYVKSEIDQLIGNLSSSNNTHIANMNNPHQVTKAQIGLGSVANYGIATNADMTTGTSTSLYVTPAAAASITNAHKASGDHDARYARKDVQEKGSIHVREDLNKAYVWINAAWRQFWPAQWS